ncbi:MAG: hypothetical protein CMH70_03715 [Nitrosomonadaceae bacterium]|nr:hypothetical protein [Nitrosomonadaceae bacterium]|tara:strand:+ start:159 stop:1169 length:1011 start_codon:yes stop_codon:yes gene_type:complete
MKCDSDVPTIAVIIPNHNDSAYLSVCIDSVLKQSVCPDQIIFVDDHSTDDSLDKIYVIQKNNPELIVSSLPTCLGTVGALNEGLKLVTCDYVLFLAANDYVIDGIIEKAKLSIMKFSRPGIWSAMVWVADNEGKNKYIYPSPVIAMKETYFDPNECIRLAMKHGSWIMGTTLFFHREELLRVGGLDKDFRGLADLLSALIVASHKGAVFFPCPLGVMRYHSGGYLNDTLSDLNNLESMLTKIEIRGRNLSPRLFNKIFTSRMKHRIRFAVMRAVGFSTFSSICSGWGGRYKFLLTIRSILGIHRKLMIIISFIIIRPFDVLPMIWSRVIKYIWIKS